MSTYNRNGGGYGITGMRNTYVNSKIRIGNFVEDAIGRELVDASAAAAPTVYESVAMQAWVPPTDQVVRMGPNHEKFKGVHAFPPPPLHPKTTAHLHPFCCVCAFLKQIRCVSCRRKR